MSVSAVYERRARLGWPTGRPTTPVVILRHRVPAAVEAPSKPEEDNPPSVTLPRLFMPPDAPNPILEALRERAFSRRILIACCIRFGVTLEEVQSLRRGARIVQARQVACWLMKQFTRESFPSMARRIGGRDHTTPLHACKKINAQIAYNRATLPVPTIDPESPGHWEACLEILASLEPLPKNWEGRK